VREEDWPEVKSRLRASANFSKAEHCYSKRWKFDRSEAHSIAENSEASLVEARHSSPADAEITDTLGWHN